MRILYLIDAMGLGGAESVLRNLIQHLKRTEPGFQVELATLYSLGHFGDQVSEAQVSVWSPSMSSKYDIGALPRLVRLVREGDYDIVHVHLFPASCFAALASGWVRKPKWIFTEHNVWNRRRQYLPLKLLDTVVYSRFVKIVAVSDAVARALIEWLPHLRPRLVTIPNGVPVSAVVDIRSRRDRGEELRLLFAGSLTHKKGIDLLIEAISQLQHRNLQLVIAGEGSQRSMLEELVVSGQLGRQVSFVGPRDDLPDFMEWADCLIVPSRWEGLPMVILEAMSVGLPVIATSVGGIPEVIEDGVNGWLVEPGNVCSLAERLQAVLEQPEALRAVGALARQRIIGEYSIQVMAERHKALYHSLVA